MACFNLASDSALVENSDQIGDGLDALNSEEWSTTVQLLSAQLDSPSFSGRSEPSSTVAQPMKSYRFAYLMALKSNRATARKLFIGNLLEQSDGNLPIAEFRQLCALDAALSGELKWPSAMKIIQATYAQGAAYHLQRLITPGRTLPDEIASEVLRNPTQYPATLWDFAESVASTKARRAIRAVGPIAKAEKWFVN
jgi:hypothetical protein